MSQQRVLDFFPFGGTYAPVVKSRTVPIEEWPADLRRIKEHGFSAVRGWVGWDRIERREGARDWTEVDTLLEAASAAGLRVMLNVGGVFDSLVGLYPPRWLVRDHHCQHSIPDPSKPARPVGPRWDICIHDPLYREKAAGFLGALVRRVAASPALFAWGVWNEPQWPGCYCPHTQERFRGWLQRRYSDLRVVNDRWGTEFPVDFTCWDEIEPPLGVGFRAGGYAAWLDWELFCEESLTEAIGWVAEIVRANDPQRRPTTLNLTPGDVAGGAVGRHTDLHAIASRVDVLGYSHYTYRGSTPADRAARLDRVRCASASGDAWIIETESGPVYWVHGNLPGHTPTAERIQRYWQAVGHNVTAIFYWLYRTRVTDAQAGEFGLTAWDGSPTERSRATGAMAALLQANATALRGRGVRAEAAILVSQGSLRLGSAEGYEGASDPRKSWWERSWLAAYKLLFDRGVAADFVSDEQAIAGALGRYRLLLIPFHPDSSPALAGALRSYVAEGGRVIAEFPFGFKDSGGILQRVAPGHGLAELFGCSAVDALPATGETLRIEGAAGPAPAAAVFVQQLRPAAGAEVLGRWADGTAAIVGRSSGRGRATLAGTLLFLGCGEDGPGAAGVLLDRELAAAGITPVRVEAPEGASIEVRRMDADDGRPPLLLVLNHTARAVSVRVRLPEPAGATARELVAGATLRLARDAGGAAAALELAPWGAALLDPS